jgi:hypothetical protein
MWATSNAARRDAPPGSCPRNHGSRGLGTALRPRFHGISPSHPGAHRSSAADQCNAACHAIRGGDNPATGKHLEKLADKETLMPAVKEAFAYCDDLFAGLTSENALQMVTVGAAPRQWQTARANQLTMVIAHGNEHYGNLVTYMRMKGIVPPSSSPP